MFAPAIFLVPVRLPNRQRTIAVMSFSFTTSGKDYGDVSLNGLNAVMFGELKGNVWDGDKLSAGLVIDASASEQQRDALTQVLTGKVGRMDGAINPPH